MDRRLEEGDSGWRSFVSQDFGISQTGGVVAGAGATGGSSTTMGWV
jgi:hypothetical protein